MHTISVPAPFVAPATSTAKTDTQSATRLTASEEEYVLAVFREVARLAAQSYRGFDADDIASEVALGVVASVADLMVGYPDPVFCARQRARHAGISFDRRERAQRGEGARLHVGKDGLLTPGRRSVSADVTGGDGGDGPLARAIDPGTMLEVAATDRMVAATLLQRCFDGVPSSLVREVWLVDGCGFTVQEVAASCGQRRETVSRRLNHARSLIRQNHAVLSSNPSTAEQGCSVTCSPASVTQCVER